MKWDDESVSDGDIESENKEFGDFFADKKIQKPFPNLLRAIPSYLDTSMPFLLVQNIILLCSSFLKISNFIYFRRGKFAPDLMNVNIGTAEFKKFDMTNQ